MDRIEPAAAAREMKENMNAPVVPIDESPRPKNPIPPSPLWQMYKEQYESGLYKKALAAVIATYLLVFATCGAGAISANDQRRMSQLGASVAGGLIVTVMIYAVGHISGAHMNPAVTLAFAAIRHFPWKQTAELAGIAVGPSVCITSILAGPVSGGSINPKRTIGSALVSKYYKGIWIYIVGPVTGTLIGLLTYKLIRVSDKPAQTVTPSISFKLPQRKSGSSNCLGQV